MPTDIGKPAKTISLHVVNAHNHVSDASIIMNVLSVWIVIFLSTGVVRVVILRVVRFVKMRLSVGHVIPIIINREIFAYRVL